MAASDKSRSEYQGLLVTDARLRGSSSLWGAESTYGQATPKPGVPAAQGDYELVLHTSGEQTAAQALRIQANQGGNPHRLTRGGGFVWRDNHDSVNGYRGWEAPQIISGWDQPAWSLASSDTVTHPDAVTLEDGQVVVVAQWFDNTGSKRGIVSYTRTAAGVWGSQVIVHEQSSFGQDCYRPAIMIAGERLFCFFWYRTYIDATYAIRCCVSTDKGATWAIANEWCSSEALALNPSYALGATTYALGIATGGGRLRARYFNGQTLVVAHLKDENTTPNSGGVDVLRQYAATDHGMNLDVVETWAGASSSGNDVGGYHDLVIADRHFVLTYIQWDAAANDVQFACRRSGSATIPLSSTAVTAASDWITAPGNSWAEDLGAHTTQTAGGSSREDITDSDLASCVDDAGVLWVFVRKADTGTPAEDDQCVLGYSDDGGQTWSRWGRDPLAFTDTDKSGNWWYTGDTGNSHPTHFCATWQQGRVVLLTNGNTDAGTYDGYLSALYLGGYHDVCMPWVDRGDLPSDRACFEKTCIPYAKARGMSNRVFTSSGTQTHALLGNGPVQITTGDGLGGSNNGVSYTTYSEGPTALPQVMLVHWAMEVKTGGSLSDESIALQLRLDDSVRESVITFRFTATQFRVYDAVSGATLVTSTALAAEAREWRVGMSANDAGGGLVVWYRPWNQASSKQWTHLGTYSVASQPSTAGTDWVRHGHITSSGAVTQNKSWWYMEPSFTIGNDLANVSNAGAFGSWPRWIVEVDNPDRLPSRPYSPSPVYVDDGVYLRATDGPAIRGDTHHIDTRYLYPIERIFPAESRSPRTTWRSADTTVQRIALEYDAALTTQESEHGATLLGLSLQGVNFRTGLIERYDQGTAAWVTVVTIDTSLEGGAFDFTRTGSTVEVGTVNPADSYMFAHELAGAIVDLNGTFRRLSGNTEGKLDGGYSGRICRMFLVDPATGDPASGTSTLRIIPRNVTILFHSLETSRGWRLTIDAQTTAEPYFEIGALVFGPVHVFGFPNAWGRVNEMEPGYQLDTHPDGSTSARAAAPSRRTAQIAWTDGIDLANVSGSDPDPNYITTTTTANMEPAGAEVATAYELEGVIDRVQADPVVYLPRIPRSTDPGTDVIYLRRRHEQLYGSIRSPVRVESIQGGELADEVVRVAEVVIAEEL